MYYIIRFDDSGVVMAVHADSIPLLEEEYPRGMFKYWHNADGNIVEYEEASIAELWSYQLNNDMWIQGREFK